MAVDRGGGGAVLSVAGIIDDKENDEDDCEKGDEADEEEPAFVDGFLGGVGRVYDFSLCNGCLPLYFMHEFLFEIVHILCAHYSTFNM